MKLKNYFFISKNKILQLGNIFTQYNYKKRVNQHYVKFNYMMVKIQYFVIIKKILLKFLKKLKTIYIKIKKKNHLYKRDFCLMLNLFYSIKKDFIKSYYFLIFLSKILYFNKN